MDKVDNLLLSLYHLYYRLQNHKGVVARDSLLTKWKYFLENSEQGAGCTYAQKARHLFLSEDLEEVKRLLSEVNDCLQELEK